MEIVFKGTVRSLLVRTGRERICQHFRKVTSNPSEYIVPVNPMGTTRLIKKPESDPV